MRKRAVRLGESCAGHAGWKQRRGNRLSSHDHAHGGALTAELNTDRHAGRDKPQLLIPVTMPRPCHSSLHAHGGASSGTCKPSQPSPVAHILKFLRPPVEPSTGRLPLAQPEQCAIRQCMGSGQASQPVAGTAKAVGSNQPLQTTHRQGLARPPPTPRHVQGLFILHTRQYITHLAPKPVSPPAEQVPVHQVQAVRQGQRPNAGEHLARVRLVA